MGGKVAGRVVGVGDRAGGRAGDFHGVLLHGLRK